MKEDGVLVSKLRNKVGTFFKARDIFSVVMMGILLTSSAVSIILKDRQYIISDGINTVSIRSFCRDINEVLNSASIKLDKNDRIFINDIDAVTTNVNIRRAVPVSFFVDGHKHEINLIPGVTVEDALTELGIELRPDDALSVPKDSVINSQLDVVVDRVDYKTSSFTEDIPFLIEKKDTDSLLKGKTKIERAGVNGKKEIVLKEKFVNGSLVESETWRTEKVLANPVSQVELVGTKVPEKKSVAPKIKGGATNYTKIVHSPVAGTFVDYNGKAVGYEELVEGYVTAYSPDEKGDTGIGFTGVRVLPGVHCGVNPNIIPLWSKVYVEGEGYFIAADIGGELMRKLGIVVDMRVANIREARNKGKRWRKVYIVRKGK